MRNKSSNLSPTPAVHLLKSQIARMDATLRHLHGVMGSHINALDRAYDKGENVKPVKIRTHVLKALASPFSTANIFSDVVRGLGSMASLSSGGGSSGMSQGQIWAEAAKAISRAMKRNL